MAVNEGPIMPNGAQQTLGDVVYDQILAMIMNGTWAPRSRLPSEATLAEQFGVSRPVVRQALARLRENGYIASRQGSGSFVQDVAPAQPEVNFPRIGSIADLQRFLMFREGVEGEGAAVAAVAHTEERPAQLKRASANMSVTPEGDFEFHLAVATSTENVFYINILNSLRGQMLFCMRLARSLAQEGEQIAPMLASQHMAIADAIIARKPDEARELMREHLKWSGRRILTGSIDK